MAKATSKGDVSVSESDNENPRSTRKQTNSASKNASKDKERVEDQDEGSGDEDEEDDEEYEIEAILDAKHGTFPEGRIGYLVKWKGYSDEHNSWVDEQDAEGAKDLIADFWRKHKKSNRKSDAKPKASAKAAKSSVKDAESEPEVEEAPPAKKRGRPSKAGTARDASDEEEEDKSRKQKKPRKSTGSAAKSTGRRKSNADAMDEDEDTYADMRKLKDLASWEHLVDRIDTVERTESGDLFVYFTLKNGKGHAREKSELCKKKMPFKLIDFYESNLRWKPTDEDAMEE
ncbi:hypothetical protein GY45DRAFT_1369801 [Cubamyces sp. BRFM 1775]|nr:hypothetical protein GY45DRAFT_1369801 [Cubamyces sp. BRFM 1775]